MSAQNMIDMVEEILKCSICLEVTSDPRVLQCQHTFCCECLVQYAKTKDKKDEVECPTCRKLCPIPNGNVKNLPESFFFNQLKNARGGDIGDQTEVDDNEKETTDKCTSLECPGKLATAFCKECHYICVDCETDHKSVKILKPHVIISINKAAEIKDKLPRCAKHQDQVLRLYCVSCSVPICLLCYPLSHNQHECVELSQKASEAREELKSTLQKIDSYFQVCNTGKEAIKCHSTKLDVSAISVKKQASDVVNEIKVTLMRHEGIIHGKVEQASKEAATLLKEETDRLHAVQKNLESVQHCGEQLIKHGKPCDFLNNVNSIQKKVKENNPNWEPSVLQEIKMGDVLRQIGDLKDIGDKTQKLSRDRKADMMRGIFGLRGPQPTRNVTQLPQKKMAVEPLRESWKCVIL